MREALAPGGDETSRLSDFDRVMLRRAIRVAFDSLGRGDGPYGAVVVSEDGRVISESGNLEFSHSDVTAHAEVSAIRGVREIGEAAQTGRVTLYSSAEPCPMCTGAIFVSGISRVVFGIGSPAIAHLRGGDRPLFMVRCKEILQSSVRSIEVVGPCLVDEASGPFVTPGS